MRRLLPNPSDLVTLRDAYEVRREAHAHRPWLMVCMVSGLDGSTVVGTTSRGLSNPADQQLLMLLRTMADVVLVGANTARIEGYGPPKSPHQRVAVVSRSAQFDFDAPIWTSGQGLLVLPEDAPEVPVPSVRAGRGSVNLGAALSQLADLGAAVVQAEGGPMLNGALATADLVDELNLTISPQLTGGDGPRLTVGASDLAHRMDLAHVLEDDGFLFTRWVRRREA